MIRNELYIYILVNTMYSLWSRVTSRVHLCECKICSYCLIVENHDFNVSIRDIVSQNKLQISFAQVQWLNTIK